MTEEDERQAVRGITKTLARMRSSRFGLFEYVILIAVIIMLVAGFLSIAYVVEQQVSERARDRIQMLRDRNLEQLTLDVKALLLEVRNAAKTSDAALRKALEDIERLLERQTQIIIREHQKETVRVVFVTPSPQPTATVTCDPTPVLGDCRRGNRGG